MVIKIKELIRDQRGANFTEYIILLGVVALLGLIAFQTFGSSVSAKVQSQAATVQSIGNQQ